MTQVSIVTNAGTDLREPSETNDPGPL